MPRCRPPWAFPRRLACAGFLAEPGEAPKEPSPQHPPARSGPGRSTCKHLFMCLLAGRERLCLELGCPLGLLTAPEAVSFPARPVGTTRQAGSSSRPGWDMGEGKGVRGQWWPLKTACGEDQVKEPHAVLLMWEELGSGLSMLSGAHVLQEALGLGCHLLAATHSPLQRLCTHRVCGGFYPRRLWGLLGPAGHPGSRQGVGSSPEAGVQLPFPWPGRSPAGRSLTGACRRCWPQLWAASSYPSPCPWA